MQIFAERDQAAGQPLRIIFEKPRKSAMKQYISLLSAGIARAPAYERNWLLTSLFGQGGPGFANGSIAEEVQRWLRTGRAAPVSTGSLSRYQLAQKRGARWVYETFTQSTLLDAAWRRCPALEPILVEGSPDMPYMKTMQNLGSGRRTHHFVLVRVGGCLYVIDGARGMVFDSLGAYLDTVMLPGHWGESSVRMKWFRIFEGGREVNRSLSAEDSWETPVT
jgi:hypothetical protein